MRVHEFQQSLKLSHRYANAPWWEEVYRAAFPAFSSMVCVRADGWAQRGGIDRVITLSSGKTISVDEKVRTEDWPDFALERWSDRARQTPGWVQKDLACDFIAYAFIPSQTCYLLPFLQLRRAWIEFGKKWIEQYPIIHARNPNYETESVCVPIEVVLDALVDAMRVRWLRSAA